jgi:hypothetical protein
VQLNSIFLTDDLGPLSQSTSSQISVALLQANDYKYEFNSSDAVSLYLDVTNEFTTNQTVISQWQVTDSNGRTVPELTYTETRIIQPGWWWWSIDRIIPVRLPRGEYTFTGQVTYDGITTTKTKTFTIDGPPTVEAFDVFVADQYGTAASLGTTPQSQE